MRVVKSNPHFVRKGCSVVMKKFIILLFCMSYFMTVGYTTENTYSVTVTADATDIKPAEITAQYTGNAIRGVELNKEDFVVIPYYKDGENLSLYEGSVLDSSEFEISPSVINDETGIVTVSYGDLSVDVQITCSTSGQLIIKTDGLDAKLTVDAIKQEDDDVVLSSGKDIVYLIQSTDSKVGISESMNNVLNNQREEHKDLEVLKVYDINVTRKVSDQDPDKISNLNDFIYLTLPIPDDVKRAGSDYWVIHEHANVIEILKDLDSDEDTITIKASTFSSYILYRTNSEEEEKEPEPEKETKPKNQVIYNYITYNNSSPSDKHVHTFTEVVSYPTCTEPGYRDTLCTGCSYCTRDWLDALGHSFVDGVCVRCGYRLSTEETFVTEAPTKATEDYSEPSTLDNSIESFETVTPKKPVTYTPSTIEEDSTEESIEEPLVSFEDIPVQQDNHMFIWLWLLLLLILLLIIAYLIYRNYKKKERSS